MSGSAPKIEQRDLARHPTQEAPDMSAHRPDHDHDDEHDRGLAHDLPRLLGRRRVLRLVGGGGLAVLAAGCGTDLATTGVASSGSSRPTDRGAAPGGGPAGQPGGAESSVRVGEGEIPEETTGPYPGDGSNGVNVLAEAGIVRSDITASFGSASAVAEGVPLTVELTVVDVGNGGAALAGAAIYLWQCDRNGEYSLYSPAIADQNYLRGVQATDRRGRVSFASIYPGAYSGRWPHIHFEVYPSLDQATSARRKMRTSQIALPEQTSAVVYAVGGYEGSARNLAESSLETDNVFSDGYSLQMARMTGTVADGFTARLTVPV
jgi:protocatechuate 3,4-dioxygenase beta subunit